MDMHMAKNLEEMEKLFASRMCDYEEKLEKVTSQRSPIHSDVSSLSREFSEFKSFVWQTLRNFKTQMELLALGFERHETYMRRKVLLIHGLPEKQNEKLPDTVHKVITNQLKLSNVTMDNLRICHRLGAVQGKTRPVLVRFFDMEHRQAVWENKTMLKGTGITISEFLTQSRHRVFATARQHFGIKHSWTVEGKVVVLLPDKTRRKIETMQELQSVITEFPAGTSSTTKAADVVQPLNSSSPPSRLPLKKTRRR